MINFDGVDFSERRPEEVISFFWRSVYNGIGYTCFLITTKSLTKLQKWWKMIKVTNLLNDKGII